LKKHIIGSHIREYDELRAEIPDRTFYEIFKELRTNNKFPFVDFKFFESTNDLTNNNQDNLFDLNLENNLNINNHNLKIEDKNSLLLNFALEQASGNIAFNGIAGGFGNLINENNDVLSLNSFLSNLKNHGNIGLSSSISSPQVNLNLDSFKLANDLNAYLNFIQIQQAQQNAQTAQNQNQNFFLQSLVQAFNLNNQLTPNNIAINQIRKNLSNLQTEPTNDSSGSINNLNFLGQLSSLGNGLNKASEIQNNCLLGNLNSLNFSNNQNTYQSTNNPYLLNISKKLLGLINNNQNNDSNNNNFHFPINGEMIKNNNNNNHANNNLRSGNDVISNLSCLGNLSQIIKNYKNENFEKFDLREQTQSSYF